jgi:gamma-glutamyltranspeptidase
MICELIATTGESTAIDARESAPSASTEDMYNKTGYQNSKVGPLSIGVPGELAGYWHMFQNHSSGQIKWKDLFTDTIKLCEEGFSVSQHLNDALIQYSNTIMNDKSLRDIYVNPKTNRTYSTGELLIQKQLGETLRNISEADNPKDFFYKILSQKIVEDIKKSENSWNITTNITVEDFINYTTIERHPVLTTNLRGNITLHAFPLPGQLIIAFNNYLLNYY